MNKVAKGARNEKRCEDELKSRGYTTWRTRRARYLNLDMFGLFDVVGVSKDGAHMLFVQVKSNRFDKKQYEAISEFKLPSITSRKEMWVYMDGRKNPARYPA